MKIKVCGITRKEDALVAAGLGADALGFIFAKSSPRCISPNVAADIISMLPASVLPVGVFRNETREHILRTVQQSGVRTIQLHGDETPREAEGYPLPVWKAFGVDDHFQAAVLGTYDVDAFLLDTRHRGVFGGTGGTFDWTLAVEAKRYGAIVLAGGITPDNAAQAAAGVRPYALDVNSGVEYAPGCKDHAKLRRLFASVGTVTH
jgi:phosphoribosylanthranilate isomerase